MTKIASNLQIDSARLWDTIHETAKFGATPKGGVRRLTLGPEDKQVRDWFRKACEAAGLEVHVDALGSMFGLRKGRDMSKPPVGLGSHLDTQPTGGKFDGVLGTLAALEVVRTLNDAGIETETPICIVNWTNEEGSRFAPATMASAAYAGDYTTEDILARNDAAGVSVGEALDSIGYRGDEAVGARKFGAFVELHIEQGPLLEAENKTIGVVDRGQGIIWYDGKITGFESHAGTTPMPLRRDALATLVGNRAGGGADRQGAWPERGRHHRRSRDRRALAQRHPRRDRLYRRYPQPRRGNLDAHRQGFARRGRRNRGAPQGRDRARCDLAQAADDFDTKLVDAVESAAKALGYQPPPHHLRRRPRRLQSRQRVPAAMVFVPCKDGISHNELEDATQADCAAGANVADAYGAGACRRRVLIINQKPEEISVRGVFVDANESLAVIFERLARPGDPEVRIHRDPDITPDQSRKCSTAPRSRSSITPRCRPRSRANAPG